MIKKIKQIISLPKLKIEFINKNNDDEIFELYKYFVKRHKKYKIIKNKTIGVMLYEIPKTIEKYENDISGKNGVGYFSRRCKKMGYYTAYFKQQEYLDDLYDINTSAEMRQGKKMTEQYLSKVEPEKEKESVKWFGIFNDENKLVRIYKNYYN